MPFAPAALTAFRNSTLDGARAAAAEGRIYVLDDDFVGVVWPPWRAISPNKAFMRAAAVLGDVLVLAPACALLALRLARAQAMPGLPAAAPAAVEAAAARTTLLLLAQPVLLFVDHGHFQHNGVMLGLTLGAVAAHAAATDGAAAAAAVPPVRGALPRLALCAALFALALNFKQSALYYAPAFFVALLLAGLAAARRGGRGGGGSAADLLWRGYELPALGAAASAIALMGASVAAVFMLLWAPFCLGAQSGSDAGGAATALSARLHACAGGLHAVWRRLFPLARNIFEDKVANVWCALEPLLRLRARLSEEAALEAGPGALHGAAAALCAGTTLLLALPSLCLLARRGAHELRLRSTEARGRRRAPPSPLLPGPREASSGTRRRRRDSSAPAAEPSRAAQRGPGPAATAAPAAAQAPPALFEHLLLALSNAALACFLAGYQVHEKSVLLPLLPMQALHARLPLLAAWLAGVALFSLGPLLAKDALLAAPLPLAAVLVAAALHLALGLAAGDEAVLRASGAREAAALRIALRSVLGDKGAPAAADLQRWLQRGALATAALGAALALAAALVPPPPRLPDLHAFASAAASAAMLGVALAVGSAVQYAWVREAECEGGE